MVIPLWLQIFSATFGIVVAGIGSFIGLKLQWRRDVVAKEAIIVTDTRGSIEQVIQGQDSFIKTLQEAYQDARTREAECQEKLAEARKR